MFRVLDIAVARKLIAFMTVLAATLTIALPGNSSVATKWLPDPACGQHQIDARRHVFDTLAVMLDATRMKQEARLCFAPPFCCD